MKRIALSLLATVLVTSATAAVMRGQDGRWYGNVCITQVGWQIVPWQMVGSMCFAPMYNQYGFIANS